MIGTNTIIDVSHYTPNPDFGRAAAAGITAVFQKASEGFHTADPTYAANRAKIAAAGLLFGSYHFFRAGDGAQQADHFLSVAQPAKGDLLVLDFEQPADNPAPAVPQVQAFVQRVQAQTGMWPGLYSGPGLLKQALGDSTDPVLSNCWLWLAQYPSHLVQPTVQPTWPAWTLWQYTDGKKGPETTPVDGIGPCDRNTYNGTPDQLAAFWQANGLQ